MENVLLGVLGPESIHIINKRRMYSKHILSFFRIILEEHKNSGDELIQPDINRELLFVRLIIKIASRHKHCNTKLTRSINQSLKTFDITNPTLLVKINEVLFPNDFYNGDYTILVFGDTKSRDCDCVVILHGDNSHRNGIVSPLTLRLQEEIKTLFPNETLDICIICTDQQGNIIASSKGGSMTATIVKYTYHMHYDQKSKYTVVGNTIYTIDGIPILQCPEIPIDESIINMVLATNRHIIGVMNMSAKKNDNAFDMKTMKSIKPLFELALREPLNVLDESNITIKNLMNTVYENLRNISPMLLNRSKMRDFLKTLALKIAQLKLLLSGQQLNHVDYFQKDSLAKILLPNDEMKYKDALFLLFRGTNGGNFNQVMIEHMIDIMKDGISKVRVLLTPNTIHTFDLNSSVIRTLFENDPLTQNICPMFDSFYKDIFNMSPELCSIYEEMKKEHKLYPTQSVFRTHSTAESKWIELFGTDIWEKIHSNIDWIDQKSPEWIDKIQQINGVSTIPRNPQDLFRGCIGESITQTLLKKYIVSELKLDGITYLVTVGFISHNGKSMSPDGLLITKNLDGTIIIRVIEIKTLKTSDMNSDKIREIKLASIQISSMDSILRNIFAGCGNVKIAKGIILFIIFNREHSGHMIIEQY